MIDYELAKQLKEAGFPIIEYVNRKPEEREFGVSPHLEILYIPTLSELIEACGEQFVALNRGMFPNQWMCLGGTLENHIKVSGSNPSEAVANLWLALNKK